MAICTTLTYVTSSATATLSTISSPHGSAIVTTSQFPDGLCVTSVAQGSERLVLSSEIIDQINNSGVFSYCDHPSVSLYDAINNPNAKLPFDLDQ